MNLTRALLALPIISFTVYAADKPVDMADPTAVYSSFGANAYTNGDLDLSAGLAWGKNMLAIESKQGFDALNVRYANMDLWNGIGVYAESTAQLDKEFGTTASIGAVSTWHVVDNWTIYPVLTVGGMELTEENWITTGTAGLYNRFNLSHGFSLGLDPFYTYGESDFNSINVDAFVSYQVKNHQIRIGYSGAETSYSDFEGESYIKYKMAF